MLIKRFGQGASGIDSDKNLADRDTGCHNGPEVLEASLGGTHGMTGFNGTTPGYHWIERGNEFYKRILDKE